MASTVLSGASNPSYRNNTDQNVRIVINYMQSTQDNNLVISWAGVSAGGVGPTPVIIGRNLAFSNYAERTEAGGIRNEFVQVTGPRNPATDQRVNILSQSFVPVATAVDVEIALNSNNASGRVVALPTELMIAPGQVFSAICGVYNIVVIPENG